MMKNIYILSICLILFSTANSQNLFFEHLGIKEGLSQLTINDIYQDELGQLWFATRDGLNKYDGNEIKVYKGLGDDSGLFSSDIRDIEGDNNGLIYIRDVRGLTVYNLYTEKFRPIFDNIHMQAIHYNDNKLWVAQNENICYLTNSSDSVHLFVTLDEDVRVRKIMKHSSGYLVVATNNGLIKIDDNRNITKLIEGVMPWCIYEDSKKTIWIGTAKDGLFCISENGIIDSFKHDPNDSNTIINNFVRSIAEDDSGNYWIGTYKGLNYLNNETKKITSYISSKNNRDAISDLSIHSIRKDRQGTLWIGTFFGGINKINPELFFNQYYKAGNENKGLSGEVVGNVTEDKNGNLWICTDNAGLNFYDRKKEKFSYFKHSETDINTLSANTLKSLCLDEENHTLWVGSHIGGLDRIDLRTHKVSRESLNSGDPEIDYYVRCIVKYKDKLILGTHHSAHFYDPKSKEISSIWGNDVSRSNIGQIWDMILDSNNNLWLSTRTEVFCVNLETHSVTKMSNLLGVNLELANIFEDKKKNIWIGTSGQGVFVYNARLQMHTAYTTVNSNIIDNYILDIEETSAGFILLTTNAGLARLDPNTDIFKNYKNNNFFAFNAFNERSLFVTKGKEIVLSGTSGMMIIKETDLIFEPKSYTLNFTNLNINNKIVMPNDETKILDQSISKIGQLYLDEKHSVFSVDVVSNNYVRAINPQIKYTLDGFDEDWISLGNKRTITYTNLDAGSYTLRVKASDAFSMYETPIRELSITVRPYFYKTWYAYIFYVLLFIGILYITISRVFLKNSLKYAQYKAVHIQEVNESKMKFFINVSHEIRTPITLIAAQIDYLLKDATPSVNNRLLNMRRNAQKLKDLINELLDFRKQELGYVTLQVSKIEIVRYLKNILNTFEEYANSLGIKPKFISDESEIYAYFDTVQMDKVFYNLLSNAFKYTPKGGEVCLSIKKEANSLIISVQDTGIGIKEDHLKNIFTRFYQVDDGHYSIKPNGEGTGIGLSLVKNILELHHASITVQTVIGEGSIFDIRLLLGTLHLENDEKIRFLDRLESNNAILPLINLQEDSKPSITPDSLHTIHIVEDNDDLRNILIDIFTPLYSIKAFSSAEDAYDEIVNIPPALVILDVMLPNMSGIELCSKIKSNLATCHIPVVLLTAAANSEKRIEGLQSGADDYIAKPFDVDELVVRCNNIINNRLALNISALTEKEVVVGVSDKDKRFIVEIESILNQNIEDSEFNVDNLCEQMHIARTSLFVRLKEITGQSPSKFIQTNKLKTAFRMLKEDNDIPINEIAYAIGYQNPSYFIKIFKAYYGVTPHEYRKTLTSRSL